MAEKNEEVRERKLRRLAKDIGLELRVSRTYYVVERDSLETLCVYNLTLDSAEKWLRETAAALAGEGPGPAPGSVLEATEAMRPGEKA